MKLTVPGVIALILLIACSEPAAEFYEDYKSVEEKITALAGGTLATSDSIKLTIPPDAIPVDGVFFLGRTGKEPESVPNENIQVEGDPFTIRFPSDFITKPVQLQFPLLSDFIDTAAHFLILYNGSTYFPVAYRIEASTMHVSIDRIDWDNAGSKGSISFSEIIVLLARYKQTIPEVEMGLKRVEFNTDTREITYHNPAAGASSKVLLLVHGWTASPAKWNTFIPWFLSSTELAYDELWTFGYNSSWSIHHNGEILAQLIKMHASGAQIDIVAHSMGGLVSRSMIEKHGYSSGINRLITLGSPHEGSPLAVFRYALGALVAEDNPEASFSYNYNTQGFRDLDTASAFIAEMKQLDHPPLPYYTLATTNNPNRSVLSQITSDQFLEGPDDGIVSVKSAHGVSGAYSPEEEINIPVEWAHLKIPEDSAVYEQVVKCLLRN